MISPDMMTLDTTVSTETPMIKDDPSEPTTMMPILDDTDDLEDALFETMETTMEPEPLIPKEMLDETTISSTSTTTTTTTTTTETIDQIQDIDDEKDNEIDL